MAIINFFKKKNKRSYKEIAPDEIFMDSKNLPDFDTNRYFYQYPYKSSQNPHG
jgi:hypothetical protein